MSGFYVDLDANGNEVKTPKTKGPTRRGYMQVSEGIWKKDPNYTGKFTPAYEAVTQQSGPKYDQTLNFVYAKIEDGKLIETKKVKKGRPSLGYQRLVVKSDGSLFFLDNTDTELKLSNELYSKYFGEQKEQAKVIEDDAHIQNLQSQDKTYELNQEASTIIENPGTCGLDDIAETIKSISCTKNSEDNTITYMGCDIAGVSPIEYLNENRQVNCIRLNLKTGDVHIWNHESSDENPDVVIQKAFSVPNLQSA